MKRPTMLLGRVLLNEGLQTNVAVERDIREIECRFEHEGMSFLTITLPILCDALDQALAIGRITPSMFNGFKPFKRGGKLPALLSGFFMRVFESDGSLLEQPCVDAVRAIRQVTRLFKKVELPCSSARTQRAFERYVSNDEGCSWDGHDPLRLRRIAGYLWSDLQSLSAELHCSPGIFGTGATAERLAFNERHDITSWPERSEDSFPASYHAFHDGAPSADEVGGLGYHTEEDELPVRVVQVPKTLKTPRIISVEPSYMMLMQQSVAKPLMDFLESDLFKFNSIRFTDQSVNKDMARVGSLDGSLATIDLKDASDLISNSLVNYIFGVCPDFLKLIQDSRSTRAKMPDGSVVKLRKFASMGSALCFPIEAMTFFTIIVGSLVRQSGKRPSPNLCRELTARVSVYGDDIIVPTEAAAGVIHDLEAYGLKVNTDKSFLTGSFRESCGGDYFRGHDVTPAYCRYWDDTGNARGSRVLSSYISLSNQFYLKGLWNASQYIRDHVSAKVGAIPRTRRPVGGLTFASILFDTNLRWAAGRSGWRVKAPTIRLGHRPDTVRTLRGAMLLAFGGRHLADNRKGLLLLRGEGPASAISFVSSNRTGPAPELDNGSPCLSRSNLGPFEAWRDHYAYKGGRLEPILSGNPIDQSQSVDSYASNVKRRWIGVHDTGTW